MAALTALAIGSMALTAASTYSQYKGAKEAAKGSERMAKLDAEMNELEAKSLEAQAADAKVRGAEEEGRFRLDVSRFTGAQRARLAAQGIDIDSGSASAVQMETAILGELDALTIRNNAAREAWGFQTQASLTRRGGAMNQENFRNQAQSARNAATSTLLTGAAQLGAQGYDMWSSRRGGTTVPRSAEQTAKRKKGGR